MKISYIANIRLPTEKAHGIQIMKMCEAFALRGHEVQLIVQKRNNPILQNPFDYYSIDPIVQSKISITYITSPNLIFLGKIGFWIQAWLFSELASIYIRRNHLDVVYSRDYIVLLNMFFIHKNLVWEAHRGEEGFAIRWLLKKAKLVSITWGLAHIYEKLTNKILIAPDGVDLKTFTGVPSQEECRKKLGLPENKNIALYCGHLYDWKGAQYLADAALGFNNYELAVFVGGTEKDVKDFTQKNKNNDNILVVGRKSHSEISFYLKSANVLVLPNSGKEKISSQYTSPLKLFEYLASGTPIISSDLPSLREVLNEKTAIFFTPDDSKSLFVAVKKVFMNGFTTDALKEVQEYSWEKRADKIVNFIKP